MTTITNNNLPAGALLQSYANSGAYTDCFIAEIDLRVSHAEFVEAFYTTPIFRLERWLLAALLWRLSTDHQAREMASGRLNEFAAWSVESRAPNQVLLASGRTRSWLMTSYPAQGSGGATTLYFGSAIVPHKQTGKLGWLYSSLLGFHKLYSRILLWAAKKRLDHR